MMESRLFGPGRAYLSARSRGVRRGQTWPWSAPVDADTWVWLLVGPGNTNQTGGEGYWVGTTPPPPSHVPTWYTPPRYPTTAAPADERVPEGGTLPEHAFWTVPRRS